MCLSPALVVEKKFILKIVNPANPLRKAQTMMALFIRSGNHQVCKPALAVGNNVLVRPIARMSNHAAMQALIMKVTQKRT